jgi:chlorobactene glucosyltransferase
MRNMLIQTTPVMPKKFTTDTNLPTITVAIPARNETAELTDCLHSVLRSNYPKLEVLVLDDCSQANSSDIIRKFAHRGVRFIKGKVPPESWIAKNYAYDQLLEEASGQYVLFCGTDVRFDVNAFRQLTEIMLKQHINMLSVLPLRNGPIDRHLLLQPMRYWRELAIPPVLKRAPPVLSTCWMAKRDMLLKNGGFDALRKTIRPERYIARGVSKEGHYKFLRASSGIGISSVKNLPSQWATAVRTRYPEQHNQPETVFFTSLWQAFILIGPIASLFVALVNSYILLSALSMLSILYLLATHYYIYYATTGRRSLQPVFLYPTSVLMEIVVLNYSMWAYEFSEVIWKGRNVCLPVLATNLRLPKID